MDEKAGLDDSGPLKYDDILKKVGGFGAFQRRSFAVLTLVYVAAAMNTLGYLFWAGRPDHWCDVDKPPRLQNVSDAAWKELVIPKKDGEFERCRYRASAWDAWTAEDVERVNAGNDTSHEFKMMNCRAWKFDQSQYASTVVMEVRENVPTIVMLFHLYLSSKHATRCVVSDGARLRPLLAAIHQSVGLSDGEGRRSLVFRTFG